MKVSIETNDNKIVIEDAFDSSDVSKRHDHNERLVSLAYNYIMNSELMLNYENGKLERVGEVK